MEGKRVETPDEFHRHFHDRVERRQLEGKQVRQRTCVKDHVTEMRGIFAMYCIMAVSSLRKHKQPALSAETAELSCYGETPTAGQRRWRRREWRENCAPSVHVSRRRVGGKRRSSGKKSRGIDESAFSRESDATR